jgi:hypothetical protein
MVAEAATLQPRSRPRTMAEGALFKILTIRESRASAGSSPLLSGRDSQVVNVVKGEMSLVGRAASAA